MLYILTETWNGQCVYFWLMVLICISLMTNYVDHANYVYYADIKIYLPPIYLIC